MILYFLLVPLSNIAEYIGQEKGQFRDKRINFVIITRIFITILTVYAIMLIQSFARSFQKTLPFLKFTRILTSFLFLQAFYNIVGAIVRISQATVDPYSQYETYQLLFVCIFSGLFTFLIVMQCSTLSPSSIEIQEGNSLVYQARAETELRINQDNRENLENQEMNVSHVQKSSIQLQENGVKEHQNKNKIAPEPGSESKRLNI